MMTTGETWKIDAFVDGELDLAASSRSSNG